MPILDHELRARRPPRPAIDPWRPLGFSREEERLVDGTRLQSLTVFLAGSECPFTCSFCDLWRFTFAEPTPPGALPAQLRQALDESAFASRGAQLKLYNASNFFDNRAVPPSDEPALIELLSPCARVVVECHPRLIGRRALAFGERLPGRLQVAMGLETVHPEVLPRLNKRATLDDFARAADELSRHEIGWRAFVLVGLPFVPPAEAAEWAARSTAWAFEHGAEHVSLIPLRDSGELTHLVESGELTLPSLRVVEDAFDRCRELGEVVSVDPWDLDELTTCPACRQARRERLERINLSGRGEPPILCESCG